MKHLFVMDPPETLNYRHDSTWAMMLEASSRGDTVFWCHPSHLYATAGKGHARYQKATALEKAPYFQLGDWQDTALDELDIIWMRKDPPFDMSYIFATYLLELSKALVVNSPQGLRSRNEKLFAFTFQELTPPTLITSNIPRILEFAASQPDRIVLKPWDGNGGRGVLVTRAGDPNLRSMAELLTQEGKQALIAQRYIPEIVRGDKRIILIDGIPAGAMLRVPGTEDHRGNMHAGAEVHKTSLTARDQEICARIGPVLQREGFYFVGIDIIGGFLTEINVTSPTGIQDINRLEGSRLEARLYDAILARV
jgi:glutathione synthase